MGEAILVKAGTGLEGGQSDGMSTNPTVGYIFQNGQYICTKSGNYEIITVGGGAGGMCTNSTYRSWDGNRYYGYSGGNGYWNKCNIYMNRLDSISVIIGPGGNGGIVNGTMTAVQIGGNWHNNSKIVSVATSGGISSFGKYSSSNGGSVNTGLTLSVNNNIRADGGNRSIISYDGTNIGNSVYGVGGDGGYPISSELSTYFNGKDGTFGCIYVSYLD